MKEEYMATLHDILMKQHEGMFKMLDTGLSSIPDKSASDYSPEELTALRLVLHSIEAIDNYWSTKTPPNFGEFLSHGIRSSNREPEFPAYTHIKAYLAETSRVLVPDGLFLVSVAHKWAAGQADEPTLKNGTITIPGERSFSYPTYSWSTDNVIKAASGAFVILEMKEMAERAATLMVFRKSSYTE
jgi:hypothetical protein